MSVHYPAPGESHVDFLRSIGRENDGIAEITVAELRAKGYGVKHAPEPGDPRHYEVTPAPPPKKKTKKNDLFKMARLVREPSK